MSAVASRAHDENLSREQRAVIEALSFEHASIMVRQPFPGPTVVWGLDDLAPCEAHGAIVWPTRGKCACRIGRSTMYLIGCDGSRVTYQTKSGGPLL